MSHEPVEHLPQPPGLGPVNGYSHVAIGTGRLVSISGQLPVDGSGALVGSDAFTQTQQVFRNIDRALAAAGARREQLLRLTVLLTDRAGLEPFRAAREEYLGELPRPTSTLMVVAGLALPGALVEIDALAVLPGLLPA
jgi:enamine deaminase RidA (YjgF/YER057c/UK114 family)